MPSYIIDTDIWIRIWRNHPPDIYARLWELIDTSIAAEEIRSPEEVLHELERGDDLLAPHLQQKNGLFVPLTPEIQVAVSEVMERCPSLQNPDSERNRADPFVVALALHLHSTVVTNERPRRSNDAPLKIPDACNIMGVSWLDWFQFLRANGWQL